MSDKRANGTGEPSAADEPSTAEETEAQSPVVDEDEIPVEVEATDDTRPVKVPDLGAAFAARDRADAPVATDDRARLSTEDLLELLGQAETEKAELARRIAELEQGAASLEAEKKDLYERMLRGAADMENLRKRTRKEVEDARIDARGKALKEMLPVVDNLDRAVSHAETSGTDAAGVTEGVQLVLRQFTQALERCDVHAIEAAGQPFDPNVHEAVSQIESADHPPGTVVEVLQRGYTIGPRLLRASLVVVASAPARPAEPPTPMPPADDDPAEDGAGDGAAAEGSTGGGASAQGGGDSGEEPGQEA